MTQPRLVFPQSLNDPPITDIAAAYQKIRGLTRHLTTPLEIEDFVIQSGPEASPPKWHLGHTTWFFETFILQAFVPGYTVFHPQFQTLFNSYYESVSPYFPRQQRGTLSRPTVHQVIQYREAVDAQVLEWINAAPAEQWPRLVELIGWGLQHEQQHQELLMMDILANFAANPMAPAYAPQPTKQPTTSSTPLQWLAIPEGRTLQGHGDQGFAFDNERPRHATWLTAARIANRPVTNGEFLQFLEDGGYQAPEFWLSDGWQWVQEGHSHPRYWSQVGSQWFQFTLSGRIPLDPNASVVHVSYFEADAYARWHGARLIREEEWEWAATHLPTTDGPFLDDEQFVQTPAVFQPGHLLQALGGVWEWTQSAYRPYPGYRAPEGMLAEYNGKFMNNQYVLRGGCAVTPKSHVRPTYRNFFHPSDTWQLAGIRLAEDAE